MRPHDLVELIVSKPIQNHLHILARRLVPNPLIQFCWNKAEVRNPVHVSSIASPPFKEAHWKYVVLLGFIETGEVLAAELYPGSILEVQWIL